ncbi:hypothetical protein C8R44DRAFT_879982 [Mycena epipterygia]|nr:hypothetical protein C8R44DRAFT_879982 [Mycena epipterygia]
MRFTADSCLSFFSGEDTHSTFNTGDDWANRSESPIYQRAVGYQDCCMSHSLVLFAEGRLCIAPYWNDGYPYGPWRGVTAFSYQVPILRQLDAFAGLD